MKVKMKEVFQGTGVEATLLHDGIKVSILEKEEEYMVSESLGAWLIENGKAELIPSLVEMSKAEEPKIEEPKIEKRRGRKYETD